MGFDLTVDVSDDSAEGPPSAAEVLGGRDSIPPTALFDRTFLREHTSFRTFGEMVRASPSSASSPAELGAVPGGEWDAFAAETTAFEDWEAMVAAARERWFARQFGL
ncbi:hypothetical protein NDI76_18175 [Halogeometricum sp. S1BR25-6]|uniref:Uncharacterized protein n=1 Tax=Halogeometricum salsisoli TaxID=2950536 RepID=A0ABU2GIR6_9EURY|nr:hypothetical protein [Halogeometricum sp. S1BR25-6]MDS0300680.1 hypothetical protein [Halogeometricum sp. S1BR25-6]